LANCTLKRGSYPRELYSRAGPKKFRPGLEEKTVERGTEKQWNDQSSSPLGYH